MYHENQTHVGTWVCWFGDSLLFLGGDFKDVLFSPLLREMIQFDYFFSDGLKPPTSDSLLFNKVHHHHSPPFGRICLTCSICIEHANLRFTCLFLT